MKKVILNNNTIAVGLYWAKLSGAKLKAEMAALSEEVSKPLGFTRKVSDEDGSVSYQAALTDNADLKGVISGAAVIADKYQDIIFIQSISDDEAWICAVSNHEVLAGGDRVVSVDEAQSVYDDLLDQYGDDAESLAIVVAEGSLDIIEGIEPDESYDFGGLLENADIKRLSREFSEYKISPAKSDSRTLLLLICAAISISAMGYHFVGPGFGGKPSPAIEFSDNSGANESADKVIVPKNPEPRVTTQDRLNKAYDEEVDWLRNKFNSSQPDRVIMRMSAFDMVHPRNVGGWSAVEYSYNSDQPSLIAVLWTRGTAGTPLSLKSELSEYEGISFDLSGQIAKSYHRVMDKSDRGMGSDFDIIGYIDNSRYTHESMMHDLISMHYTWIMSPHDRGNRPSPIPGIPGNKGREWQLELDIKNVQVSGTNRTDMSAFVNIAKAANTFLVKKITIDLNTDFQWTIDGELYEIQ